jgi:hypothetical protein
VADAVRTTLGPRGMDKLVSDGRRVTISNDGATIMRLLEIEHPAAKTLVDISMSQVRELLDRREGREKERERERNLRDKGGRVFSFYCTFTSGVGGGCCDSSARCPDVIGAAMAAIYFIAMMKNPSHI